MLQGRQVVAIIVTTNKEFVRLYLVGSMKHMDEINEKYTHVSDFKKRPLKRNLKAGLLITLPATYVENTLLHIKIYRVK